MRVDAHLGQEEGAWTTWGLLVGESQLLPRTNPFCGKNRTPFTFPSFLCPTQAARRGSLR